MIGARHQAGAAKTAARLTNGGELFDFRDFGGNMIVRAGDRAIHRTGLECLVHDLADGACAPPALRAAAETAIHLIGGGGPGRGAVDDRTDFAVGQNVAGTNDHTDT